MGYISKLTFLYEINSLNGEISSMKYFFTTNKRRIFKIMLELIFFLQFVKSIINLECGKYNFTRFITIIIFIIYHS